MDWSKVVKNNKKIINNESIEIKPNKINNTNNDSLNNEYYPDDFLDFYYNDYILDFLLDTKNFTDKNSFRILNNLKKTANIDLLNLIKDNIDLDSIPEYVKYINNNISSENELEEDL